MKCEYCGNKFTEGYIIDSPESVYQEIVCEDCVQDYFEDNFEDIVEYFIRAYVTYEDDDMMHIDSCFAGCEIVEQTDSVYCWFYDHKVIVSKAFREHFCTKIKEVK